MTLRFAVFGDVHGRVALMLTLARRWQQEAGLRLDGILQAGDMGAFPDHARLDASTRRFARKDPDELGFRSFLSDGPEGRALLAPDDSPPIAFCRGNHEDFDYLGQFAEPAPLDPWRKLWFVPDGTAIDWSMIRSRSAGAPVDVCVGAFGGAAPLEAPDGCGRRARNQRRRAVRAELTLRSAGMGPRFRPVDLDRALCGPASRRRLDVLLTHAGPDHPDWRGGSAHLARLARAWRPRVHLFGHHHQVVGPVSTPQGLLVGLEHLDFLADGRLRPGAWGILSIDEARVGFEWARPEDWPWLCGITRWTWRFDA